MYPKPVYIVDGARTPFLKSKNRPGPFAASDLATQAGRALLMRQPFRPDELDEVILGCAAPSVDEVNIGRVAALRMGCGQKVPGWTVMRNCASGMQAVDSAISNILAGRSYINFHTVQFRGGEFRWILVVAATAMPLPPASAFGLLCALEFQDHAHSRAVTRRCADKGLLVVPTRNGIVRLLPDLLVAEADVDAALAVLRGVLAEI